MLSVSSLKIAHYDWEKWESTETNCRFVYQMSGAASRTGFWLVENLAWAGLSYKLKLRAIYVWTFELHTVEQACHFHALDFEFVSKQTLITEIVPCYKELRN